MATITSIFVPAGGSTVGSTTADVTGTITTLASTAEIILGRYQLFALNANGDINIRFGNTGMPAAAATDFRLPAGSIVTYRIPAQYDRFRLFNAGAGTVTFWIQPLTATT